MLACAVTAASARDAWGAVRAPAPLAGRVPRLGLLRADAGSPGALASWAGRVLGCRVEVVHRAPGQRGLVVLKGRWVVERTFGWLGRSRRLSKGYEAAVSSRRAMVPWAMAHLMLTPDAEAAASGVV